MVVNLGRAWRGVPCISNSWRHQSLCASIPQHGRRYHIKRGARLTVDERAGTVITADPGQTRYEDVIQVLPQLKEGEAAYLSRVNVLATPSLAHWFSDEHPFLRELISRIFSKRTETITSTSAIVDRIPCPPDRTAGNETRRLSEWEPGFEGLCYVIHSSGDGAREPMPSSGPPDTQGEVRFVCWPDKDERRLSSTISVRLPVANTIFSNGRSSTILEHMWEHNSGAGKVKKTRSRDLHSFDIILPRKPFNSHSLHLPLDTLTEVCTIESGMGNIIRRLKSRASVEVLPASTELEKAVPAMLGRWQQSGVKHELRVYALIVPRELGKRTSASSAKYLDPSINMLRGATLHRVTGGGGGWGNKQGLLSLDPAVDFDHSTTPDSSARSIFESTLSAGAEPAMPSGVVKNGDFVQFFATAPTPSTDDHRSDVSQGDRKISVCVGVSPQMDAVPESYFEADETNSIVHIPDQYGMLSEQGLCLEKWDLPGLDNQTVDSSKMRRISTTRIDVPLSYTKTSYLVGTSKPADVIQHDRSSIPQRGPLLQRPSASNGSSEEYGQAYVDGESPETPLRKVRTIWFRKAESKITFRKQDVGERPFFRKYNSKERP